MNFTTRTKQSKNIITAAIALAIVGFAAQADASTCRQVRELVDTLEPEGKKSFKIGLWLGALGGGIAGDMVVGSQNPRPAPLKAKLQDEPSEKSPDEFFARVMEVCFQKVGAVGNKHSLWADAPDGFEVALSVVLVSPIVAERLAAGGSKRN